MKDKKSEFPALPEKAKQNNRLHLELTDKEAEFLKSLLNSANGPYLLAEIVVSIKKKIGILAE